MNAAARKVLLRIARCEVAASAVPKSHPCRRIVGVQANEAHGEFQVPEPWRGDIENAPLLFVSSNPGLGEDDDSPRRALSDDAVIGYYETSAFPSCYPRNLRRDGKPSRRHVAFWSGIRGRAAELFGVRPNEINPGRHFALTEVVHCKSQREVGVRSALTECSTRHFADVAALAGARVVVLLGGVVGMAFGFCNEPVIVQRNWYGRNRHILWLPHPNARQRKTVGGLYSPAQIEGVQRVLTARESIG